MKLSKRAVRKLLKVKEHILEEPLRLKMGTFVITADKIKDILELGNYFSEPKYKDTVFPKCNTVGCIAGWTVLLTDGMLSAGGADAIEPRALEILGLPTDSEDLYDDDGERLKDIPNYLDLFYVDNWPKKFETRYAKAKTPKARAKVVAARIDAFIEQYG